jgi:integrase
MATIIVRPWIHNGEKREAYQVSYTDASGARKRKQFDKRKDAVAFQKTCEGTASIASGGMTVAEAATAWLNACELGLGEHAKVERSTLKGYQSHVNNHIVPEIGGLLLRDLTTARIKRFRDALIQKLSRPLAKAVMQSLKAILAEAVDQEVLDVNRAADVSVTISSRDRERVTIPTQVEMGQLLATAQSLAEGSNLHLAKAWRRYLPLVATATFTGMRASELRGLAWPAVDLAGFVIKVVQRADQWKVLGKPKSQAGTRDIDIPKELAIILREWKLACPVSRQNLVFPNGEGNVESVQNIYTRCWYPLQERAGVTTPAGKPKYTMHSLRHFKASAMIAAGATAKEIMVLMGHSSITMTFDRYGHLFPEGRDERKRRVEATAASLLSPSHQRHK